MRIKRIELCDDGAYYVTESDVETLRRLAPGLARLVKDCRQLRATHFVCADCGQIAPVKLRGLHKCFRRTTLTAPDQVRPREGGNQ